MAFGHELCLQVVALRREAGIWCLRCDLSSPFAEWGVS